MPAWPGGRKKHSWLDLYRRHNSILATLAHLMGWGWMDSKECETEREIWLTEWGGSYAHVHQRIAAPRLHSALPSSLAASLHMTSTSRWLQCLDISSQVPFYE